MRRLASTPGGTSALAVAWRRCTCFQASADRRIPTSSVCGGRTEEWNPRAQHLHRIHKGTICDIYYFLESHFIKSRSIVSASLRRISISFSARRPCCLCQDARSHKRSEAGCREHKLTTSQAIIRCRASPRRKWPTCYRESLDRQSW